MKLVMLMNSLEKAQALVSDKNTSLVELAKKLKREINQNFTNVYTDTVVNNGGI
jgi:hypothetical protein